MTSTFYFQVKKGVIFQTLPKQQQKGSVRHATLPATAGG